MVRGRRTRRACLSAFLGELRRDNWAWAERGLRPQDTGVMDWQDTVVVMVYVPWVGSGYRNLQVGYSPRHPHSDILSCEWGDEWVLDGGTSDLTVTDRALTPVAAAQTAAEWIIAQLARPVERDDWLSRSGRVVASRWRLSDTGEVLGTIGNPLIRWMREPTTTLQVNPRA